MKKIMFFLIVFVLLIGNSFATFASEHDSKLDSNLFNGFSNDYGYVNFRIDTDVDVWYEYVADEKIIQKHAVTQYCGLILPIGNGDTIFEKTKVYDNTLLESSHLWSSYIRQTTITNPKTYFFWYYSTKDVSDTLSYNGNSKCVYEYTFVHDDVIPIDSWEQSFELIF